MASIGKAVPNVEIKIVGEKGKELPEEEAGEIITRGPLEPGGARTTYSPLPKDRR